MSPEQFLGTDGRHAPAADVQHGLVLAGAADAQNAGSPFELRLRAVDEYFNRVPGIASGLQRPNSGHGNDLDGVDEENPGKSDPDKKDIKFVVFCEHDHKHLCKYVYAVDEEPPQLASEGNDPGYTAFIKWEYGGPGAAVK